MVEDDLNTLGVEDLREVLQYRDRWRSVVMAALRELLESRQARERRERRKRRIDYVLITYMKYIN